MVFHIINQSAQIQGGGVVAGGGGLKVGVGLGVGGFCVVGGGGGFVGGFVGLERPLCFVGVSVWGTRVIIGPGVKVAVAGGV